MSQRGWRHVLQAYAEKYGGEGGRSWGLLVEDALMGAVQLASLSYIFSHYLLSSSVMVGPSMYPTFEAHGDVVLVEHVTPLLRRLRRGDVVTCISPDNPKEMVCKRIVAVEGDKVAVMRRFRYPQEKIIEVPRGHVWLQGDNAPVSKDSRMYGPVPVAMVTGKVLCQVWPLRRVRWIDHHLPGGLTAPGIFASAPSDT